ncbi:hypothetical protein, partial [Streptomyces sp. NPDC044948]|uniref:hypothetical protein n=1 Tax=Streptomyces sp. NPDC044948 TaxID=3157092 RepID=UPI0033D54E41
PPRDRAAEGEGDLRVGQRVDLDLVLVEAELLLVLVQVAASGAFGRRPAGRSSPLEAISFGVEGT